MRLIDIDKLAVCLIDHTDILTDKGLMGYMAEDIDKAPTIKSPIETLQELRAEIEWYKDNRLSDAAGQDIEAIATSEYYIELIDHKISEVSE